ncbi:hypothetical protein GA0070604_2455 [Micromonospora eburnea]|uniref:Uncharacterized protein n=1 Tax=Micromonospora eburnea TaxID=227316 RepID=A0A1C6UD74_9ACTN|nr:hypothetical protein GA0070604_2455 [Micromonospora eburnea]
MNGRIRRPGADDTGTGGDGGMSERIIRLSAVADRREAAA